jgi:AcrR family transcriptional regulator
MSKPAKAPVVAKTKAPVKTRRSPGGASEQEHIRDAVSRLKSERIVSAAVELFYTQGFTNTTLEQVADAINVTKPFIYAHFRSKAELLADICSRAIKVAHDALNRVTAHQVSATLKLETLVRDFMMAVLDHQPHAVIYSREETHLNPEDREAINELRRGFDRRFAALLQEGVVAGEFVVEDVPLTALAIGGIVGWSPVWYRSGGRLTQPEAAQRIATLVLAMVRAKVPQSQSAPTAPPPA